MNTTTRNFASAWTSTQLAAWARAQLIAQGLDGSEVPNEPFRFIRLKEVVKRTGLSRATIYRRVADGKFPKPVSLNADRVGQGMAA
jgi:predicted DNA-binding transcriptional regulator AlpA